MDLCQYFHLAKPYSLWVFVYYKTSVKVCASNVDPETNRRGGSLTRYHTPPMDGGDFSRELIKLAGPTILRSAAQGLNSLQDGSSIQDALSITGATLKRGLKRKLPAVAGLALKAGVKRGYKNSVKRARDILGV